MGETKGTAKLKEHLAHSTERGFSIATFLCILFVFTLERVLFNARKGLPAILKDTKFDLSDRLIQDLRRQMVSVCLSQNLIKLRVACGRKYVGKREREVSFVVRPEMFSAQGDAEQGDAQDDLRKGHECISYVELTQSRQHVPRMVLSTSDHCKRRKILR